VHAYSCLRVGRREGVSWTLLETNGYPTAVHAYSRVNPRNRVVELIVLVVAIVAAADTAAAVE